MTERRREVERVYIIDAMTGEIIAEAKQACVAGFMRLNKLDWSWGKGGDAYARPRNIRNFNADLNGIDVHSLKIVAGVEFTQKWEEAAE